MFSKIKNFKDDRLLPCPFCGEDAVIGWYNDDNREKFYVSCSNDKCLCEVTGQEPFKDLDTTIKVWNTRTEVGNA